ncbi:MAG: ABC transporter ATP-binding protein [Nitrospira sp.]|nr:ABC transporter ATP-binding protein [Nitrospira sp.]MCA9475726.1 ABC transporter ATP-binding protein [Nitrospira sp.]MCA9480978.1 ABC transporter ATP-binding protein [Nitrospira sp.]MCB9712095.1 ABC transporter ATP-binding protein [Nitrospiraceae bacterium]HQU29049.1 ABC transporter ATP-binding protein [Nitrospirales bacterium]
MIELQHISKIFEVGGQPIYALKDASETFETGDYVAIVGPSGSGKSTLLNVIGCLLRPSAGAYIFNGEDVSQLDDQALSRVRQQQIGFIFQSFHLVPRLTALDNVALPMVFAGIPASERRRRAEAALEAVGLTDRAGHRPNQLSVGQRQRVVIARAIIMQPSLLLADEPTGNLDTHSGHQIMELLESLNVKGLTLIVVTHDPNVARRANRVIVLTDGQIVNRLKGQELSDRGMPFS